MGLTFARALAARGTDIVLVARNLERLEQTQAEIVARGVDCEILQADLAQAAGVAAVKERLLDDSAPITVFVNNAGAGLYTRLAVTDATKLRNGAEVMGLAPMELGGAVATKMKERGDGTIITTTSVAALVPMGAYSAVKGMVKIWSDSLAIELTGTGVQVTAFVPGWVRTEFHQRSGVSTSSIPSFLWLDSERVVSECLADVEKGKTISIPSKRFKVLAFLAQHAPKPIVAKVVRKLNKGRR